MDIVLVILIGLGGGPLAGRVVSGHGYGVLGDIVVGVVGALVGGWVFVRRLWHRRVGHPRTPDHRVRRSGDLPLAHSARGAGSGLRLLGLAEGPGYRASLAWPRPARCYPSGTRAAKACLSNTAASRAER